MPKSPILIQTATQVPPSSLLQPRSFIDENYKALEGILNEHQKNLKSVHGFIGTLSKQTQSSQTNQGLSFLHAKYHLLLSYCKNLCFYMLLKASGKPVNEHPVVFELVKLRVYLEKLKPIENKLKYQIDRLVHGTFSSGAEQTPSRTPSAKPSESINPLDYKPNLKNLMVFDDDEDKKDDESDQSLSEIEDDQPSGDKSTSKNNALYKAPKIAPAYFNNNKGSSSDKTNVSNAEKLKRSRLIEEFKEEFSDRPTELLVNDSLYSEKGTSAQNLQRLQFEEDNLMRFSLSKKDSQKKQARNLNHELKTLNSLDIVNDDTDEHDDSDHKRHKSNKGSAYTKHKSNTPLFSNSESYNSRRRLTSEPSSTANNNKFKGKTRGSGSFNKKRK